MKTVAFVPVKLNNERLPGKNLKKFDDGTPLISILLNKLDKMVGAVFDEAYVYCSSDDVRSYLPGNITFLKRPERLDGKMVRGTEIYGAFVDSVDADVYALCHATSPFVSADHIRECVDAVIAGGYDSAFCAKKIQNFLWQGSRPLNFVLNDPPRTQEMEPIFMEQSTPYVFTRKCWELNRARSGTNPFVCECSEIECIDIDYPEDFELANVVYTHLLKGKVL